MKHIRFLIVLMVCICQSGYAQMEGNKSEMQLYITGGMKFLQPKYFGHTENISPGYVPTLGGGVLWQVKQFSIGGEFSYTDGKKHTADFGTIFTGINFNLIGGYTWNLGQKYRLSAQSGFGYSLYHLSTTDKNYSGRPNLNTTVYHNFIYTVPVSAMIQRVHANGTFVGLRAGYNFNVMPNEWRYIEGLSTEVYTASADGPYFQVILGGLLKLKQAPS